MKRRGEDKCRKSATSWRNTMLDVATFTPGEINTFAATFYKDVADIYDCITRIRNIERNPTGFSLHDAPILGLLVRVWKLLKEIIKYYEADNAEIISVLERPLIEASVTATYLLTATTRSSRTTGSVRTRIACASCGTSGRLRFLREQGWAAPSHVGSREDGPGRPQRATISRRRKRITGGFRASRSTGFSRRSWAGSSTPAPTE